MNSSAGESFIVRDFLARRHSTPPPLLPPPVDVQCSAAMNQLDRVIAKDPGRIRLCYYTQQKGRRRRKTWASTVKVEAQNSIHEKEKEEEVEGGCGARRHISLFGPQQK